MPNPYDRGQRPLNRDFIKYIAMFTMVLNHLHGTRLVPDGIVGTLFTGIGYFTFITMIYFLVEGYDYTHDRRAYGQRLLLFAVLSQIPYSLAMSPAGVVLEYTGLNVMFTLYISFQILVYLERGDRGEAVTLPLLLLSFLSLFSDWAPFAPIFTILFYRARHEKRPLYTGISNGGAADSELANRNARRREKDAFLLCLVCFTIVDLAGKLTGSSDFSSALVAVAAGLIGPFLAFLTIHYGYNGKRMRRGRKFSQWFFYIFYPAHLTVLGLLRIAAGR